MRILIAPDKFKGTLTAAEAAAAMRRGAERAASELGATIEIDECPVADGGEGTLEAIRARFPECRERRFNAGHSIVVEEEELPAPPGRWLTMDRTFPMRDRRRFVWAAVLISVVLAAIGTWLLASLLIFEFAWAAANPEWAWFLVVLALAAVSALGGMVAFRDTPLSPTRAAYIEVAQVIGLAQRPSSHRDPEWVWTEPVGNLIHAALCDGCGRIVIGLGGSASVDGGIGAAIPLGVVFRDFRSKPLDALGVLLERIASISMRQVDVRIKQVEITALCDVANPLLGPTGAARMFGPQKGATPEQVERLEHGLARLVRACRDTGLPCDPDAPGAGAAGGLGFGLATFLGARLVPGAEFILDLVDFNDRLRYADLVLTGEGRMDSQTALGKAPASVAGRASAARVPCIAIVGATEGHAEVLRGRLASAGVQFARILPLTDLAHSPEQAKSDAGRLVEESARRAVLQAVAAQRPTTL